MGLVLEVEVTEANLHDLHGAERLIDDAVHENHPTVVKARADQACVSLPGYAAASGINVEVTKKATGISGSRRSRSTGSPSAPWAGSPAHAG
jgi:hypothetical protein